MSAWISEGELMKEATKMEHTTGEHTTGERAGPSRRSRGHNVQRAQDDPESDCVVVLQGPYNN
jgi:hypothetical protein